MGTEERLQKILAHAGYGSRRTCEEMIEDGRVAVDGRIAHLGDKADPASQQITLDGTPIRLAKFNTYVMLYKPRGAISTTSDPEGRRTVLDLVSLPQRLYPVGRLDADSEGLLLLTDDGEVTQRLTHPSYEQNRVYKVLIIGVPDAETLDRWHKGIMLDDKPASFDKVVVESQERGRSWLRVTVHEGRKHLVRRTIMALGFHVLRLIRVQMGPLHLGKLRSGRWRYLRDGEVQLMYRELEISQESRTERKNRTNGRGTRSRRRPSGRSTSRRSSSSSKSRNRKSSR